MPDTPVPNRFSGYPPAHYTMVPDLLFDVQLPDLSGAELKVLLYIIRHTFGWKKDSDDLSLNQIMHGVRKRDGQVLDRGTGLSRDSVTRAIKSLSDQGYLLIVRNRSQERGDEPTTYALHIDLSGDEPLHDGSPNIGPTRNMVSRDN